MELEPAVEPRGDDEDEIGELFVMCCPQDREFAKRTLCPALAVQSPRHVVQR
jgi:hypothetical protein